MFESASQSRLSGSKRFFPLALHLEKAWEKSDPLAQRELTRQQSPASHYEAGVTLLRFPSFWPAAAQCLSGAFLIRMRAEEPSRPKATGPNSLPSHYLLVLGQLALLVGEQRAVTFSTDSTATRSPPRGAPHLSRLRDIHGQRLDEGY